MQLDGTVPPEDHMNFPTDAVSKRGEVSLSRSLDLSLSLAATSDTHSLHVKVPTTTNDSGGAGICVNGFRGAFYQLGLNPKLRSS